MGRSGDRGEVVGERAGDGFQLVRLGPRGDAEAVHLAGEHPGPETDALGAPRLVARRVHLHSREGDGTVCHTGERTCFFKEETAWTEAAR